jgi:NAD(P)-dependent dehydrogenase (short-subunit alcohol dehydrogenase family)
MSQKVAFVTGGNRGLGLETARQLAKLDVKVVIGSRDGAKGAAAAKALEDEGLSVDSIKFDVVDSKDAVAAYEYFNQHYGRLDILINNAGIGVADGFGDGEKSLHTAADVPQDALRRVFETNFFAVISLTHHLLPLLRKSDAGRIVNLSSILGSLTLQSDPKSPIYDFKSFAYDASKSALNAYTVHLAYELRGTNIKVNSAHPGWVKTDLGGADAMLEIPEGAKTAVDLALIGNDGPNGAFLHLGSPLPW